MKDATVWPKGELAGLPHPSEQSQALGPLLAMTAVAQDPDGSDTTTEYENWFDRMAGALVCFCLSFLVFGASVAMLWVNERRAARMDALLGYGESECICVQEASDEDRGELVHVSGGSAVAKAPVKSKLFSGVALKECLRLMTTVEVYQWIEIKETSEKKDMVGGGKTITTTYTYEKRWESSKHHSSQYHNKKMQNRFPVTPQIQTISSPNVEYVSGTSSGSGWVLPSELVSQLTDFQDASDALGSSQVTMTEGGISLSLRRAEDGHFFYSATSTNPQIGDVRVKFGYIADSKEVTVLALQAEAKKAAMTETFLPYRPIRRGLCGISAGARKEALITEGMKTQGDLVEADQCNMGIFNIFCCVFCFCNILNWFSVLGPPEIFNLFAGTVGKATAFGQLRRESAFWKWVFRLFGWFLMAASVMMFLEPLFMILNLVPFLEYLHLTDMIHSVVYILALLITALVSTLIVSFAYLAYRPMKAMMLFAVAAAIASIPIAINKGYVQI